MLRKRRRIGRKGRRSRVGEWEMGDGAMERWGERYKTQWEKHPNRRIFSYILFPMG
jgi:hypothetical protein